MQGQRRGEGSWEVIWRPCERQRRPVCGYLALRNAVSSIGLRSTLPSEHEWKTGISSMIIQGLLDLQSEAVKTRVHIIDSLAGCYPSEASEALLAPAVPLMAKRESCSFIVNTASGERAGDRGTNAHWVTIPGLQLRILGR